MHQNWNVSLALQVARLWLERTGNSSKFFSLQRNFLDYVLCDSEFLAMQFLM